MVFSPGQLYFSLRLQTHVTLIQWWHVLGPCVTYIYRDWCSIEYVLQDAIKHKTYPRDASFPSYVGPDGKRNMLYHLNFALPLVLQLGAVLIAGVQLRIILF